MFAIDSIRKKILYCISGVAIVAIIIRTFIFSFTNYDQVRSDVQAQMQTQIERDAIEIVGFFTQYARVSETFINSPAVIDWLRNHTERGVMTGSDESYQPLNRMLHAVSDRDENVLSAFIGSELTQEYMAEDRLTGVPEDGSDDKQNGYFLGIRPWYQHAVDYKEMLTTSPDVDIITGGISVSIEQVIYHQNQLLGAGGIDISINNIAELSRSIHFKGKGFAVLFDDKWQNVTFPDHIAKLKIKTPMTAIDSLEGFDGFAELPTAPAEALTPVQVQGQPYYALSIPVSAQMPKMTWYLVLFVPTQVIDDPASAAVTAQIITSVLTLLGILLVLYIITTVISKPLSKLTSAFEGVASGDSDLTRTIEVEANDETGRLAGYFNEFLNKLRGVVSRVDEGKNQVQRSSQQIESITTRLIAQTEQDKAQLSSVSVAATELAASANEIENNATKTSEAANEMRLKTDSANTIARTATDTMATLGRQMTSVDAIIKELEISSSNIGQVIEVINTIASQTNLLALNAAIEAARAGEQGRGFAVVADEVRGLASRTQESTEEISAVIVDLQNKIKQANEQVAKGMEHTEQVNHDIAQSGQSMQEIGVLLDDIQDDMAHVAGACVEQTKAIQEISETMNGVALSADENALMMTKLGDNASELHHAVDGLDSQLKQFTY